MYYPIPPIELLKRYTDEIEDRFHSELTTLADTDPLTGLVTIRVFDRELRRRFSGFPQDHLSVLMMDMDGLKKINDSHGHQIGAYCVAEVGRIIGKAVSDPTRIRILSALSVRPLCVCEIVEITRLGQPAVSRHLGILRDAGLVEDRREGQYVNYHLRRPARTPYGESTLRGLLSGEADNPALKAIREKARVVDREQL